MISEQYSEMMKELLGSRYLEYEDLLNEKPYRGYRINHLKIDDDTFFSLYGLSHQKIPFIRHGYYYQDTAAIGNLSAYRAGLIYSQEPSAMAPAELLDPQPGENVLDLCAAPGSKSTQIAEMMQNRGLLVVNEINPDRARILLENIERHGAENCIVLNASPKQIAERFTSFFDKVLVDAPCSGEGMLRREEEAESNWSLANVSECAVRQRLILESALLTLKEEGILVYSTCTFNTIENEEVIHGFLADHPEVELYPSAELDTNTSVFKREPGMYRILPMDGGEGQFLCRMRIRTQKQDLVKMKYLRSVLPSKDALSVLDPLVHRFAYYAENGGYLYGSDQPFPDLSGLHVMREFVRLAEAKKNRYEPDHALALLRNPGSIIELSEEEYTKYISGEVLTKTAERGYHTVSRNGFGIGLVKADGTSLKNRYPKQYRIRQR